MNPILDASAKAFRDLFQFRILWIVIWPMLAAVLLWLVLGVTFWNTFSALIVNGLAHIGIQHWLDGLEPRWIANAIQAILHMVLFVPMVLITALLITAFFAMPALIRLVADRDYPQLKRESGGSIAGNLLNAVLAVGIFISIWMFTLPLWFLGVGVVMPFLAATYLNQRLFRYDALSEHGSSGEMKVLFSRYQSSWWALGLLTGLLQFVPLLNLFAPVFTGLAFIHFGLARLASLRQVP
ncbi:MAG TPA: EI24 domain-containing protein [Gallionella sp.]|nr:EI24 domain-containing protein [Gallionella sp.]